MRSTSAADSGVVAMRRDAVESMQDNLSNPGAMRYGTEEEYFSGLAWSAMGAHVPGLSGGYFGHWRYRPDNEPLEDA